MFVGGLMNYLANSTQKQPLNSHLLGVAKRSIEILKEMNFVDHITDKLIVPLEIAAKLHDIGKIKKEFQDYLLKEVQANEQDETPTPRKRKRKWSEIYHHEISWALFRKFINLDQDTADLVEHAIYWHHPKFRRDEELDANAILADVDLDAAKELLIELGFESKLISANVSGIKPPHMYFAYNNDEALQARKNIILNCLIEADREISKISAADLDSYLVGEYFFESKTPEVRQRNIIDVSKRTSAQISLAERMSKHAVSVLGADPGAGKTSVALLFKHFCNNSNKLIIALPKRSQVDGLINTLDSDYNRLFDDKTTFQSVHSGRIQFNSDDLLDNLGADINVLIIDRLVSAAYRRDLFNEYLTIIKSDLIFDEFHELLGIPMMLPLLKVLMITRGWAKEESRPKTLFMSGTPDKTVSNVLLSQVGYEMFSRNELPEVHTNTKTFSYRNERTHANETIYSFNTQEEAQIFYQDNKENKMLVHSGYTDNDRLKKITNLFNKAGKTAELNNESVVTARLLESSFDISFKHEQLTVAHPNTVAQFLGRGDRFGNKGGGTVNFCPESRPKVWVGYEKIGRAFDLHLQNLLKTDKVWTHRQAVIEIWENFWTKQNLKIQQDYMDDKYAESCKKLKEGADPFKRNVWVAGDKVIKQGNLLRGENRVATAEILGENTWLSSEELVSFSKTYDWMEAVMETKRLTVEQRNELNELGFNFPINKNHWKNVKHIGEATEIPMVLQDYYYCHDLGLVKKSVIE
jgi:CRISPR-associated endonuclease/helicase Cas3